MGSLVVRVNGEALKEVTGISYIEGISKLRVVSKLGDKLVSNDYETDSIVMDITGSEIDYKIPVGCVYKNSDNEFIGVIGS